MLFSVDFSSSFSLATVGDGDDDGDEEGKSEIKEKTDYQYF